MNLSDTMLAAKLMGGNGTEAKPSALLKKVCETFQVELSAEDTADDIEEKAASVLDVWEYDTVTTEDLIGSFEIVETTAEVNSYATVHGGTIRLKAGAHTLTPQISFPSNRAVDLRNMRSDAWDAVVFTQTMALGGPMFYSGYSGTITRLIMPETLPASRVSTSVSLSLPCAGAVYLSKHIANNKTKSSLFATSTSSRITEELVVAPKDMDAQFHLNRFTKMTAETMVAILENLADVTEREDTYTLTLGSTNLEKLTEEQKNIAYEKGWNLA